MKLLPTTLYSSIPRQATRLTRSSPSFRCRRTNAFCTLARSRHFASSPLLPRSSSSVPSACRIASYGGPQLIRSSCRAQFHAVSRSYRDSATTTGTAPEAGEGGVNLKLLKPIEITAEEYHELSEETLDDLFGGLEELAETDTSIEVDYSSGVMTVSNPQGSWVINKQPPNKQIWLSSPISGPKRYDWVRVDEDGNPSTEARDGDGTFPGDWVYLRDGSKLNDLLEEELGVGFEAPIDTYEEWAEKINQK